MASQIDIAGSGYGNPYIDTLISGYAWGGTPIRVTFAEGEIRPGGKDGVGMSWDFLHRNAFINVMNSYEAVCNIDFQIMGDYDRADILWYQVSEDVMNRPGAAASHGYPEGKQSQVFGHFRYDVPSWSDMRSGSSSYNTILHEVGHGLGLEHPHSDGSDTDGYTPFPGVDSAGDTGTDGLNQRIWTVMSYNRGWDQAWWEADRGNAMTPMAFDIAALQRMYGANTAYHTGNDNYSVGPDWDTAGTGWRCIWDAGGNDTISAVGATENVHIELRAATLVSGDANAGGFASYYFNGGLFGAPRSVVVAGGLTIANGVVIENAVGGNGWDELIGNHAHNQLTGGRGGDVLDGREGYDTAIYDNFYYGEVQVIDMLNPYAGTLDAFGDAFISIEAVSGSPGDDHILGTNGVEALYGNGGSDILQGRWGADILDGGEGIDIAEYGTNVTVDMMFGYLNTGEAAGDSLINIEGLAGSALADDLRGDEQDNRLAGNGGNDWLRGRGGNDSIEGGAGRDTLWGDQGSDLLDGGADGDTMYGGQGDDMYIVDSADDQVIEYANEGYDTIVPLFDFTLTENSYVERIEADSADITITGNSLANDIFGGFGDNRLFGMGGDDTLDGWVGSDWIDGGEGDDVIMVGNKTGHDTYIGGEGSDTLAFRYEFDTGITFDLTWGGPVPFWGAIPYVGYGVIGSITWSGIENVRGTTGDDTLYGDAGDNRLEGGTAGHDTLYGRAGNDVLVGGLGFDTLDGGEGDDTLVGNYEYSVYGVDVMYGGAGSDTADFSNHGYAVWIDINYAGREVWTRDGADVAAGTWRQVADLDSVENFIGSAGSDQMWGNAEANRIDGRAGHDEIFGRDGDDVLTGGLGFDTLDGGEGDDTLVGTYEYNVYGVDVMYGGAGSDTADFSNHGYAVRIDLTYDGREVWTRDNADLLTGTWRQVADLDSVENLIGSAGSDQITGNAEANLIDGGDGDDEIHGGDGDDELTGGLGDDAIDGGDGTDRVVFSGARSDYTLTALAGNGVLVVGADGTDTLSNVERLVFSDQTLIWPNTPPVATIDDHSLRGNQWSHVNSWVSYSDANGDAATQYQFWDGGTGATSGYFWTPDNAHHDANTAITVAASDLDNVWVRGGLTAGSETMWVRAFDGADWSAWDSFTLTTQVNTPPVATINDHSLQSNQWSHVNNWVSYADANGQAATQYQFWDSGAGATSGYFWTPDNAHHDANTAITVAASDLDNVWVRAGSTAGSETMWVRAFDGTDWSAWDAFTFTTQANTPPVATIDDHSLQNNQWSHVNSWVSYSDANGQAATQYQFWDSGSGAASGYFWTPDNAHHDANTAITVAAADLANVWVRGGAADGAETMWVRAFDGSDWSAWDNFTLTTV